MASFINQSEERGYFSVYPSKKGIDYTSHRFIIKLSGTYTTHRYKRNTDSVIFQSLAGHRDDDINEIIRWEFIPTLLFQESNYVDYITQRPMRVCTNLWLRSGIPPADGKETGVIIKSFKYLPE